MQVPFKELNTAADHSLCQTSNQEAAPSTEWKKEPKKTFLFSGQTLLNYPGKANEQSVDIHLSFHSSAGRNCKGGMKSNVKGEWKGRFLEMQWSHTLASRRNLQTYFQVLLSNCLFALNTFGKVSYIAKVTVTTERQMKRIKALNSKKNASHPHMNLSEPVKSWR